jgi:hypothetical protein
VVGAQWWERPCTQSHGQCSAPSPYHIISDQVRSDYKHSVIDKTFTWDNETLERGRRLSIILRVDTPLTRGAF